MLNTQFSITNKIINYLTIIERARYFLEAAKLYTEYLRQIEYRKIRLELAIDLRLATKLRQDLQQVI